MDRYSGNATKMLNNYFMYVQQDKFSNLSHLTFSVRSRITEKKSCSQIAISASRLLLETTYNGAATAQKELFSKLKERIEQEETR